jgi:molecular chaperone GrpE
VKKEKNPPQKEKSQKINKQKNEELENLCKRIQADFENYKKRSQREKDEFSKYAKTDLILQILPILDNFKLATLHLPAELAENNWTVGVLQIEKQLEQVLKNEGVEPIETVGQSFDTYHHEAVEEVESEKPPGEIIEEVLAGYKLNGKVIRHAKVKVSADNKNNS